ncbi:PP-loop family-domain-containing protein [Phaeosphaeriaceae sp. PMI808]|nr:PP-loop family-domain-containing protein [Phaeosphaeriaceae sp. PMI808]
MALAFLYSRAREINRLLPQAHGFIVDHKARPESTEEAKWVAEQLRTKFGMEASIHTLSWPKDPKELSPGEFERFESDARIFRYQALGRACRDNNIEAIMVAHHGDDQAETIMMRMANQRLRTGLKGMQSVEWIPECEGIHGIYHSSRKPRFDTPANHAFPIEQGGIQILRPLLALEKSRLIATCEQGDVQWAEDKSNQIPTLTSRNAIRHIYKNHKLPEALSIPSLVGTSLYMQKRVATYLSHADRLFDQCLMKLDIQTGSLLVRFPPFSSLLSRPIETEADMAEAKNTAYCLIEKVADLVTPKFKSALGQLAARIDCVYPELLRFEEKEEIFAAGHNICRDRFTVYHLWWRQWDKASPFHNDCLPSEDFGSSAPHPKEWLLTRQTLEQYEGQRLRIVIPPLQNQTPDLRSSLRPNETYQLFDGRYWIKLLNHTQDDLILRAFQKADMQQLSTSKSEQEVLQNQRPSLAPGRFILAAFALLKPSDVRFTLPAVFRIDRTTGQEILIGLPTLNVSMHCLGSPRNICDWAVRYKKIDLGSRSASDIVVPGTMKAEIVAMEKKMRMEAKALLQLKMKKSQSLNGTEESFAGDKGVSGKGSGNGTKWGWKRQVQTIQGAMNRDRMDGLEALEDASVRQEARKGRGKKGGERRRL